MKEKRHIAIFNGEVGEIYRVRPEFARCSVSKSGMMCGKVVVVPVHRRFAVLAFEGVNGISREAFWPEDLQTRCRA